jgi:glycolate oxidase iron-sulfur subunit
MSVPPATAVEAPMSSVQAGIIVDYPASLDCIHCGLCLDHCPTYRLTGLEPRSPRGRIHLMRAVAEGHLDPEPGYADAIDTCLVCRHCESVCPAGVHRGEMIEIARDGLNRVDPPRWSVRMARRIGLRGLLPSRARLSFLASATRLVQRSGLAGVVAKFLGPLGASLRDLPQVPPARERRRLPDFTPPDGPGHGLVTLHEGCVMPQLHGRVHRASVRVLAAAGDAVLGFSGAACCGALQAHNGDLEAARDQARRTIEDFERKTTDDGTTPVLISNSAGCGAHMKEYDRLLADDPAWAERARAFVARVMDFAEHLAEPGPRERLANRLGHTDLGAVTYDDPCHLCHGQGVREQPRNLMADVPGLQTVSMERPESCCGAAGLHAMLRPEESRAVFAEKLEDLKSCGASTVVTANPGCHLQWESGLQRAGSDVEVLHLAELLDRALDGAPE